MKAFLKHENREANIVLTVFTILFALFVVAIVHLCSTGQWWPLALIFWFGLMIYSWRIGLFVFIVGLFTLIGTSWF